MSEPPVSRDADLAWAHALEHAERAVGDVERPGDGGIAAAVAAAIASLAYDGDRFGLTWAELAHLAARERRHSITRHVIPTA
jgi:hypothetical protein